MQRPPLLLSILSALAASGCFREEATMCVDVEDDVATCPAPADVDVTQMFSGDYCDLEAKQVNGEGSLSSAFWDSDDSDLICCYPVTAKDTEPRGTCAIGRPFSEADGPIVAPVTEAPGWSAALTTAPADPQQAAAWLEAAALEHASIAAFARHTLDLMALGAPAELLLDVQRAAADEVEHARLCYALASRYAGRPLAPGAFPFGAPVAPCADLISLAVSAVREGCLGETVGAYVAARAAQGEQDVEVRAVISRIAEDESRHAALSWRVVAWALRVGGEPVRAAVREAFRAPLALQAPAQLQRGGSYGGLSAASFEAVAREGLRRVVAPAAAALLAA